MSRLMSDVSPGTYVVNPDTSSGIHVGDGRARCCCTPGAVRPASLLFRATRGSLIESAAWATERQSRLTTSVWLLVSDRSCVNRAPEVTGIAALQQSGRGHQRL